MKFSKLLLLTAMSVAMVFVLSVSGVNAQGRGGGNRGGGGGMGGGIGGGQPTTMPGVDRGIDTSSGRSMGRSDTGRSTASDRSNGRSDNGINRARNAGDNRSSGNAPSDRDLPKFNGISKKLGTTPAALRTAYQAALTANPDLKFGEFISANVVASNLHRRFPSVTTAAILLGLQNDRSLGQTLRDLGVGSDTAKTAVKNAKEEIRDSEDH
ncbi:MAG TPA: Clp protease N-terminal domain-containing protein [Pyrinomonadaceae bacterium]|nr:Clp protease N-terminal domain-containing protein [Pyrinomonadaceae bacterium]